MKILYLRPQYCFDLKAGGSVTHTAGVINSLSAMCELEVVTNDKLTGVRHPCTIVEPVRLPLLPIGFNELLYNLKLTRMLARSAENFDAIYQRHHAFSFCGASLSRRCDLPLILEYNSPEVWKMKHWRIRENTLKKILGKFYDVAFQIPVVSKIEDYNLSSAAIVIVVSEASAHALLARGIPESKILVNPNGVDTELFSPALSGNLLAKKYGVEGRTLIGFIGSFGKWHGAENIVRAYLSLLEREPAYASSTALVMMGDGVKMKEVREVVEASRYSKNVIFTGLIPYTEAPAHLAMCDILVNATIPNPDGSEFFGSPTKLFEYMASGKAIICSALGQMKKILSHEHDAYLVPPGNIVSLAAAMKKLIDEPRLRSTLGANARRKAVQKYSWKIHTMRILETLEQIIKDKD